MQRSTDRPEPGPVELLVFRLEDERYAAPLAATRRIFQAVAVTRLPGAPRLIEGIVSVHGDLTPVFDLRSRFGLPAREMRPEDHLILVEAGRQNALLHVDAVEQVAYVDREALVEPERVVAGASPLSGVGRLADGLVLIHDLDRFLTEAEAEQLQDALAAAEQGEEG